MLAERESFTPAGMMSLQEASPEIRRLLILEKKKAQAREIGQQMVAEVRGGKTLEQAASERGLEVQSVGPVTRLSPNPAFGQATEAVGAAFGTPVGEVSEVVETPAGLFIVRPTARTEVDPAEASSAIFAFRSGGRYRSVRQSRILGWMPISRSLFTECWVGLVFSSPEAPM